MQWPASQLEQVESLEQLRVLWQGEKIHVAVANTRLEVEGVDTTEDLEKARAYAKGLKHENVLENMLNEANKPLIISLTLFFLSRVL